MAKWADLLISAVRYNAQETHIERVEVREDLDDKVSAASESSRADVIKNIKSGKTYATITKAKDGGWLKGQDVHIIQVGAEDFIRTDENKTAKDNLENLPRF